MTLSERLARVLERIRNAEAQYGRQEGSVRLLAVSKTQPAQAVREAAACGQRAFGENYQQEALAKRETLAELGLEWHFIGPLQANKTRRIAECFDWVHSVDRLRIAERLSIQRPNTLPALDVCLEVNISGEASKSGLTLPELPEVAHRVATLPGLRLRGLMCIPAAEADFSAQRVPLARLHQALDALNADGLALDTLSMGMSADLEAAVAEGATIVRIGTAIFGPRH